MTEPPHLDPSGRLRMVDVGGKVTTRRVAVAECTIRVGPDALRAISEGTASKGDVLAVAQVAAVQAAKRTPSLIPGCHPVRMSGVDVAFEVTQQGVAITSEVRGDERTGFEMEALTACAVAALTVYDMVKGIDPEAEITNLRLVHKEGGKSSRSASLDGVRAAVLTVSDRSAAGEREDLSGPAVSAWLTQRGATVVAADVVQDERDVIADAIRRLAASAHLVITSGGTGVAPRDVTPEATRDVADRMVPGLAEAMRTESMRITPHGMLSRGIAALVGSALVINLPGSPKAVAESLDAVGASLPHALQLTRGDTSH